jgi:hypothetical protein
MPFESRLHSQPSPQRSLVDRLLRLAADADRDGLRPEATILVAIAHSVLDQVTSL